MSKSKKVDINNEISTLYNEFSTNILETVKCTEELKGYIDDVFNNKKSNSDFELESIKKEWLENSEKINLLKETINKYSKQKKSIINKFEILLTKKASKQSDMEKLTKEWLEISSKISSIEEKMNELSKDRTSLIKKADLFFKKVDPKKESSTAKAKIDKTKKNQEKTDSKIKSITKKQTVKSKEETSDSESSKTKTKSKTKQNVKNLILESDSSSESDTEDELSYVSVEKSDSDSDEVSDNST